MAVPSGVSVCNVYLNAPISFIGQAGRVHLEVRPSASLTFVDEGGVGHPLGNFISTLDPENGIAAAITLPHVDQDGFLDSAGNAYTGWYYTASISYEYEGQMINLPDRDFQVVAGQLFADLSQIVWGIAEPAMVAPIPTVTSVEGMTGVVTLVGLGLDRVDNTSDAEKPISDAAQDALDLKAPINNPSFTGTVSGVSKSMVGLGSVDNTSDSQKVASGPIKDALASKVAKGELAINALDYGAVADGVGSASFSSVFTGTDNTTFLQNAINAAIAQNRPLYIPGGSYVVTNTLTATGSIQIIGDVTTRILGKIYDKTKSVLKLAGNRRGLVENITILGAGWLPLAGIEFVTPDSQACVLRNVNVVQCRHGLYGKGPELYNRIVVDKCEFVSNLIAGVYLDGFNGGTYGQSGPITFTHTIANGNGIPNDAQAGWFSAATTYQGVTVLGAGDKYGRQVFVKGFVNLSWIGGQFSDHSDNKALNLAEFSNGSGLTISGTDIEDIQTPVKADGTAITDFTLTHAYNEACAVSVNSVAGVNIEQAHAFAIDTQSFIKVAYRCDDVSIGNINATGTLTWVVDAFSVNSEDTNLLTRFDLDVALNRVSARVLAAMDRSKLLPLVSAKGGFVPNSGLNAHFDTMNTAIVANEYRIGYYGGDWNNPDLTKAVYWTRKVANLKGVYLQLLAKANSFNTDGHVFLAAYDNAGALLSVQHRDTNGADAGAGGYTRNEYWALPALTREIRFGFINQGNYSGVVGTHISLTGLMLFGVLDNYNSTVGNAVGLERTPQLHTFERNVSWGAAAPTAGTWSKGQLVLNSAPAVNGYLGWACTVAGTPGTWEPFGVIGEAGIVLKSANATRYRLTVGDDGALTTTAL
jgi:hypothetical protein